MKRREFFKNAAGLSGLVVAVPAVIASFRPSVSFSEESRRKKSDDDDLEMLDVKDPAAKAVEYVEDFKKNKKSAGNKCSTCGLFGKTQKKHGKVVGPCVLFPKKLVVADGYCNSWIKKV